MRLIHGWCGFGIYWALVEKLYESTNGDLEKNYPLIAYDLKTEEKTIKSIIEDFGLFNLNGDIFSHKRVKEHNVFRAKQSESGRKGAISLHYGSAIAQPKQSHDHKGKKGKKGNKGNKGNKTTTFDFESLWSKYPKRLKRREAERHFKASIKTDKDYADIQTALKNFLDSKVAKRDPQFIPYGSTWFFNWRDWVDFIEPKSQEEIEYERIPEGLRQY